MQKACDTHKKLKITVNPAPKAYKSSEQLISGGEKSLGYSCLKTVPGTPVMQFLWVNNPTGLDVSLVKFLESPILFYVTPIS